LAGVDLLVGGDEDCVAVGGSVLGKAHEVVGVGGGVGGAVGYSRSYGVCINNDCFIIVRVLPKLMLEPDTVPTIAVPESELPPSW